VDMRTNVQSHFITNKPRGKNKGEDCLSSSERKEAVCEDSCL
jgi:hypothetical protein